MALNVLGCRKESKSLNSTDSWRKIEERRKLKKKIDGARSERLKNKTRNEYREKDKEVKKTLRKDKIYEINSVAHEAEDAAQQDQMKGVNEATSGTGLFRTSMKCFCHLALTLPSLVNSLPSLLFPIPTFLGPSLHNLLVASFTPFI